MGRIYFKGLNEIRAIAALSVMFHHIELYKHRSHMASLYDTPLLDFIGNLGKNGVYIFFVLSGFLITYLLLAEKTQRAAIDLKKFYIRRILRIWPLYYLIVFLSFAILPLLAQNSTALQNETFYYSCIESLVASPWLALLLFLLFLPNLALTLRPPVAGASQAWSVGVEEQFYLIWPQLIERIKKKYLPAAFVLIAFLPLWVYLLGFVSVKAQKIAHVMINILPIYLMATGGIGAYLLFYLKAQIEFYFRNGFLFMANTAILIGLLFFPLNKILFGFIVMLEILFIIQDNFRFNLRNRFLDKIGEISYGVYMYHPMIMYFSYAFYNSVIRVDKTGTMYQVLIYCTIPLLTIFVSQLSYRFFEKRFILYKNRKFTIIASGNAASEE